jgi:PST family polysaccharide transporter
MAFLGVGQLFTWSMTLGWTLIVPRLLGPANIGFISTGMSVAGILQIVLGAGTGVYVAREAVVRPDRAGQLVASAAILRLLLAPVFVVALFIWVHFAGYGHQENLVLYLCGAATILGLLSEPILSYFIATERLQYVAISDAISKASQGLAGIALAAAGVGAVGFGWCWVVAAAAVLALSIKWIRRFEYVTIKTNVADLREVARGSAVYWATGLFFTIYLWIDTAMLSLMTSPTVVGWYGVPTRLFATMLVVPSMFTRAWLPQLVRANQRSRSDLLHAARAPIEMVFAISLPIASLVAAVASPGIHLVYGARFAHAVPILIILGISLIPMYLNIMLK